MNLLSIDPISLTLLTSLFFYIIKLNNKIDRFNTDLRILQYKVLELENKINKIERGVN
jgi:hypothetical protein